MYFGLPGWIIAMLSKAGCADRATEFVFDQKKGVARIVMHTLNMSRFDLR